MDTSARGTHLVQISTKTIKTGDVWKSNKKQDFFIKIFSIDRLVRSFQCYEGGIEINKIPIILIFNDLLKDYTFYCHG